MRLTRYGAREHTVRVARVRQSRFTNEHPAARALDRVQVGWVLGTAELVPFDAVLRDRSAVRS